MNNRSSKKQAMTIGDEPVMRFLDKHNINCERVDHPAVYTCEEAATTVGNLGSPPVINLFLRDRRASQFFLVISPVQKRIDFRALSNALSVTGITMASAEQLLELLNVEPGSVGFLSLINDRERRVIAVFDNTVWNQPNLLSHPGVNTASLIMDHAAVEQVLAVTGHDYRILDLPVKPAAL